MHIHLTVLQFISTTFGIGLLCYFFGTWAERREIKKLVSEAFEEVIRNNF